MALCIINDYLNILISFTDILIYISSIMRCFPSNDWIITINENWSSRPVIINSIQNIVTTGNVDFYMSIIINDWHPVRPSLVLGKITIVNVIFVFRICRIYIDCRSITSCVVGKVWINYVTVITSNIYRTTKTFIHIIYRRFCFIWIKSGICNIGIIT